MDVLVSPSASPCNGNIADARLKWKCPFGRLRISGLGCSSLSREDSFAFSLVI